MEITELTKKIIETFDLNIPKSISIESYNSGTLDFNCSDYDEDDLVEKLFNYYLTKF